MRGFASLRYERHRGDFAVPQCFATPQNFKRIVGPRLGLLGSYSAGVLLHAVIAEADLQPSFAQSSQKGKNCWKAAGEGQR